MALISSVEIPTNDYAVDEKGVKTASRKWLIESDFSSDNNLIFVTENCPVVRYEKYPTDNQLLALNATTKLVSGSNNFYTCEVFYKSDTFDSGNTGMMPDQNSQETDPTLRPPIVKMHKISVQKSLQVDQSVPPQPVQNTAGIPFTAPGVICQRSNLGITIEGWKALNAVTPMLQSKSYLDTVNTASYTLPGSMGIVLAKQGRISEYSWEQEYLNGNYYWKYAIGIDVSFSGWRAKVANLSTYTNVGGVLSPIVINGNKVQSPGVPITMDGTAVAAATDPVVMLEFLPYQEVDWTPLP